MRPNVELTRDPLRLELLPPTGGMELDYRTTSFSPLGALEVTLAILLGGSLLGLVITLGLRVVSPLASKMTFLALAVLVTFVVGLRRFIDGRIPPGWPLWLAAGPLIWLLSVATSARLHAVLFPLVVTLAMALAHDVVHHQARWMHAHPQLPRKKRHRWLQVWRPMRWWEPLQMLWHGDPGSRYNDDLKEIESEERRRYPHGFAAVAAATLLALLTHLLAGHSLYGGLAALAVYLAMTLCFGVYAASRYMHQLEVVRPLATVARALISWMTYNAHETRAPGVFQSPGGSIRRRRSRVRVLVLLAAIVLLPGARYFPVGPLFFGERVWLSSADAFTHSWFWGDPPHEATPAPALSPAYTGQLSSEQRVRIAVARANATNRQQWSDWSRSWFYSLPEGVVLGTLPGVLQGRPLFIFSLLGSFLLCVIAAPLVLYATLFAVGGRVLLHHLNMLEGWDDEPGLYHRQTPISLWEAYVDRLTRSTYVASIDNHTVRERDHLLLGINPEGDYPVLLDRDILSEHAHLTGDSGSGKSALGIAPLVAQLIGRPNCSVVILDLKGDMALFEDARLAVEAVNAANRNQPGYKPIPFQWFTNRIGRSTFAFNPFLQSHMAGVTLQQKAAIMMQSLGLDYGEGYGTLFYSSVNRSVLTKVLRHDAGVDSFAKLAAFFDKDLRTLLNELRIERKQYQDASHLFVVMDALASFEALNVTADGGYPEEVLQQQIDMSRVVQQPGVVYFYLHAALEESAVREIAKLALHSLLTAAVQSGRRDHQVYLCIDEFQQVVSQNLEIVLRQARSQGISVILANQTISDLRTAAANLIPTVQGNTRFRQVFSASDLFAQESIMRASGETIYELYSHAVALRTGLDQSTTYTTTVQEHIDTRMRRNDVIEVSDRERHSLVHITRGKGFTQFGGFIFPMVSDFHISMQEYKKREKAAWPDPQPGTLVPTLARASAPAASAKSASRPPRKSPAEPTLDQYRELEKRIDQLVQKRKEKKS